MIVHRAHIDTPVGEMLAIASDDALCVLEYFTERRLSLIERRISRWFSKPELVDGDNAMTARTREWLDAYFSGASADASTLPLDLRGAPFECRVWSQLRTLPPGETTTYGAIAARLGEPGAARAVGTANGANPIAIIVPCHRVIGSDGTLTGYGGGLERKRFLLAHERRWRRDLIGVIMNSELGIKNGIWNEE